MSLSYTSFLSALLITRACTLETIWYLHPFRNITCLFPGKIAADRFVLILSSALLLFAIWRNVMPCFHSMQLQSPSVPFLLAAAGGGGQTFGLKIWPPYVFITCQIQCDISDVRATDHCSSSKCVVLFLHISDVISRPLRKRLFNIVRRHPNIISHN